MTILVTGYAGLEGSIKIYQDAEYREQLLSRYPDRFFAALHSAKQDEDALNRLYEKEQAEDRAADGAEAGVLAALWKVLKANHKGATYSLKAIPVMQQTLEICEMYSLNPYRLHAPGCKVWITEDPAGIIREAAGAGVPFAVIGYTAGGVAIRRTDTEGDSSLRRPEEDEINKVMKR